MNILMLQSKGLNAANMEFKKTLYHPLSRTPGVKVRIYGPGHEDFGKVMWGKLFNWADVIIHMEDYRSQWIPPMRNLNKIKIFWSMDTHMRGEAHWKYANDNLFTLFLTAVKPYSEKFRRISKGYRRSPDVVWFPNTYPDHLFEPVVKGGKRLDEHINVAFLGNTANRGSWIERLKRDVELQHITGVVGLPMVMHLCSINIHWNRNIADDVNARTFEVLGSGGFLLTNDTPGLGDLFIDGQHLAVYKDYDDCIEKIRWYEWHTEERDNLSANGYQHCRKHHSETARARQLLNIINTM